MATTTTSTTRGADPAAGPGLVLTLATTVMATAALGALLPAAVASWTSGEPQAVQPVSVRLDGSLGTAGLPATPAVSRLVLHNDGPGPVRWTIDPTTAGAAPGAVSWEVWVATAQSCSATGVLLAPGRWSSIELAPAAELALCVRITDHGTSPSGDPVRPSLSVHARAA
jgi:hypothetical protein